ncbi:MAG: glycosyl hydrolase-related protein [Candidatus Aminicenantales bacterium]
MGKGLLGITLGLTVLSLALILYGGRQKSRAGDFKEGQGQDWKIHILSSSHQDIAWMNSPEACIEYRDTHCITPALEMMAQNPDYCFVMENMLNLMEYIERHPGRREDVLGFTREGRLEWGATFNQPYESLLSGEQLIRGAYFGRKWLKKNFPGCDARVYFNPDVPGRALQMQQILSKAGIPYMVISRYHKGFYRWLSPDGSSVLAYSPGHYTNASAILGASPAEGAGLLDAELASWAAYYRDHRIPPGFPLLHSVDFSQPTDFGPLIDLWNGRQSSSGPGRNSGMRYSSAAHFFKALSETDPNLDRITGERPNLWLYIHGPTHHWAVSAQREAGVLLPAAEIFNAVASLLEKDPAGYPSREMEEAWLAAIYPDHGWGGKEGQLTDRLFRKKLEFARDQGREMLDQALSRIAARVKRVPSKGIPIVVFNSLSWRRSDPVAVTIPESQGGWQVQDNQGNTMPSQALPLLPGQAEEATMRLQFMAQDVPGLGYKTFYLTKGVTAAFRPAPALQESGLFENDFYRVEFAPGGLRRIYDKELKADLLDTGKFLGFEIFTMQSVGNGAGEFGRVQQPTMENFDSLGRHNTPWEPDPLVSGPLQAVFRLREKLENCTIEQKVIVYNHLKRIDCEIAILDWDGAPYREFRLALPVNAPGGRVAYEVLMGVVEVGRSEIPGTGGPAYGNLDYDQPCAAIRPREVQNFLSVEGTDFGLTLSTSVAVNDYLDPTPDPAPYPILQPVLLASRRSCHGEGNWYLQEGDHHYRFSVTSHLPGWVNGYRLGIQANVPLFPVNGAPAGDEVTLPEEKNFFEISAANVLVSTVKKCEDDDSIIVRLYDIEGKDAKLTLGPFFPVAKAELVNMIEEEGKALPCRSDGLSLNFGHHAIETLKLWPK